MGKAAVLLVAGYTVLLLVSGMTMSTVSTQASDNSYGYYEGAVVRNIAIAGANMACNYLFMNPPLVNGNPWWDGYGMPVQFGEGSFTVSVDSTTSIDPLSMEPRLTLRSLATYRDSSYTVTVIMRPSNFSKFAVWQGLSANNVYWETGDSALGPVHAQGTLKVIGRPYFGGKTTVRNNVDSTSAGGHPIFNAGLETGVSIPINKSYQRLGQAASAGAHFQGGGGDLHLEFKSDSLMFHRGTDPDTTVYLPTFAPNGAIVLGSGSVFVKGTVKGRYTIGSLDSSGGAGTGRIVVTDDIRYSRDPRTDPTSTDMLGLVAYNDINIAGDHTKTQFTVHASMFSYRMGVTVENLTGRAPGQFHTLGGWIVENIYATSNGIPLGIVGSHGYKCRIQFDDRFRTSSPPFFPTTGAYEILAWYE